MVYTKKAYIEITSLEPIDDIILYDIIKKNIPNSFIKIYNVNKLTRGDI